MTLERDGLPRAPTPATVWWRESGGSGLLSRLVVAFVVKGCELRRVEKTASPHAVQREEIPVSGGAEPEPYIAANGAERTVLRGNVAENAACVQARFGW